MALPPTPEGYDNWNDYIETEAPAIAIAQSITLQEAKASIKLLEVAKPIRSEVGEPYFRQYNVFTTWADRAVLPALGRPWLESTPAPEPSAVLVMSLDADGYSGSGDWLDSTDNGNDAVLEGTPAYSATAPKFFDLVPAEGDFFTVADSATLDTMTEVSFEMWINIDSIVANPNMLFSKRGTVSDGYVGFFTTTGWTFRFGTGVGTGLTYGTAPATGVWQQVVATIGSAGSKLYINGVEVAAGAYTGDSNNVNTSAALDLFEVNPRPQMGPVRMDGKVAVFNIYNGVLSDTDVGTAFDTAKARFGL